jgi:hypothetical protein
MNPRVSLSNLKTVTLLSLFTRTNNRKIVLGNLVSSELDGSTLIVKEGSVAEVVILCVRVLN